MTVRRTVRSADGTEISVRLWGEEASPAVVLVHGLGLCASSDGTKPSAPGTAGPGAPR